jgi:predicted ribosomally synthesized peptide with SipW-like signal peptide
MKKIISWLLVVVMTAAISVGGTMAYLTNTDEDVNVFTVGNFKIDQLAYERVDVETKNDDAIVQQFRDDKPLYPAVMDPGFDWSTDDATADWNQIGKNDNVNVDIVDEEKEDI